MALITTADHVITAAQAAACRHHMDKCSPNVTAMINVNIRHAEKAPQQLGDSRRTSEQRADRVVM